MQRHFLSLQSSYLLLTDRSWPLASSLSREWCIHADGRNISLLRLSVLIRGYYLLQLDHLAVEIGDPTLRFKAHPLHLGRLDLHVIQPISRRIQK